MTALFHAHSGLRYLVLLLGVVNLVVLVAGLVQRKPYAKIHRILGASFVGSLHLQVVLGIALVALGRWYPALIGHLVMMLLAATVAQVTVVLNRKRPQPGLQLPLIGVVLAFVCIFVGVMAIGRNVLSMTPA